MKSKIVNEKSKKPSNNKPAATKTKKNAKSARKASKTGRKAKASVKKSARTKNNEKKEKKLEVSKVRTERSLIIGGNSSDPLKSQCDKDKIEKPPKKLAQINLKIPSEPMQKTAISSKKSKKSKNKMNNKEAEVEKTQISEKIEGFEEDRTQIESIEPKIENPDEK
ncbi:unnamed protein product [Caenorhabditis angaria]|uniref:Uncharacterized protein n=1 Tax=Caenorhabditis angaria TaxID=860376 RepID=A0A9P1N0V8_9PELO|nr:unnamed protein product [Caenorhabditis angaria]